METQVAIKLKAEFTKKNEILNRYCEPSAPLDYYADLYGDSNTNIPYVAEIGDKHIQKAQDVETLLQIAMFRSDMYVYSCSFFNGYVREKLLNQLFAFVVDLDGVSSSDLNLMMTSEIKRLAPTYVVNSGQGVHLVYMFDEPVDCYKYRIATLKSAVEALKKYFSCAMYSYKVDETAGLTHAYRVVGSLTKLGQRATAYRIGKKWGAIELLKKLNIDTAALEYKKQAQSSEKSERTQRKHIDYLPNTQRGFYDYVKYRITHDVDEGHRYLAMYALAITAYKCRVPRAEAEEFLSLLIDVYNQKPNTHIVKDYEIKKAMTGYCSKATTVKSTTLEELLGVKFERKSKRNGRKRADHLEMARAIKDAKQAADKKAMVRRYLSKYPSASLNQMVNDLGISKTTAKKYKDIVLST